MRLDEFKQYQKRSLVEFKQKADTPSQRQSALKEASLRLQKAGITDHKGNLTKHYR